MVIELVLLFLFKITALQEPVFLCFHFLKTDSKFELLICVVN